MASMKVPDSAPVKHQVRGTSHLIIHLRSCRLTGLC
jgi:hypothetical protein